VTGPRRSVPTDILAIADTHLAAGQADRLIQRIEGELRRADLILHAGDITHRSILDALTPHVPAGCLHAVRGNNDVDLGELPERLEINVDGCRVAMVHDSGPAAGRSKTHPQVVPRRRRRRVRALPSAMAPDRCR
jgi:predicted phosphodiesterase